VSAPIPRVVFVDHVARLSGGEIALVRLLAAMRGAIDPYVVLGEDGPLVERLRADGIPVEIVPLDARVRDLRRETVTPRRVGLVVALRTIRDVWRLQRRLRQIRPDIVHTNSLKAALYGGLAGRLARVPVVWHVRDRIADDYLPPAAVRFVRLASRVLPTAVICNSKTTLASLPERLHAHVLYNPVLPDTVERPAAWRPTRGEMLTIGVIGRLAPWKGQEVFLVAFAEAFAGREVRGRVIGSAMFGEDDYAEALVRRADELGIATQVEFTGFREDVWSELSKLDVLVHCSTTPEPFGQVVVEGMAAGIAVVASAAGGPAEIVTDGVDGILVRPNDARALADALRRLAADPELRLRLGAAAQIASRDFTPERTAERLSELYARLLDGRAR
jgi:glycosyltransferase involved in cell wall biosynthesis